eukprot:g50058.t1
METLMQVDGVLPCHDVLRPAGSLPYDSLTTECSQRSRTHKGSLVALRCAVVASWRCVVLFVKMLPHRPSPKKKRPILSTLVGVVLRNWFPFCMLALVGVSYCTSEWGKKGGWLRAELTIHPFGTFFILFLQGFEVDMSQLTLAAERWDLHMLIQFINFVLVPGVTVAVFILTALPLCNAFCTQETPMYILIFGGAIVSCLPPPISTGILMTAMAGGNTNVALFNVFIGQFICLFATPAWLFWILASSLAVEKLIPKDSFNVPKLQIAWKLVQSVMLPMAVGKMVHLLTPTALLRPFSSKYVTRRGVSSWLLLAVIYAASCDTWSSEVPLDMTSVLLVAFTSLVLQLLFLGLNYFIIFSLPHLRSSKRADLVPSFMCSNQKSLQFGVTFLNLLFGKTPDMGVLYVPLLVNHIVQLTVSSVTVGIMHDWVQREPNRKSHTVMQKAHTSNRKWTDETVSPPPPADRSRDKEGKDKGPPQKQTHLSRHAVRQTGHAGRAANGQHRKRPSEDEESDCEQPTLPHANGA